MRKESDETKPTDVNLKHLETKLVAYLDDWRRDLGVRKGSEVSIERQELRLGATKREGQRR